MSAFGVRQTEPFGFISYADPALALNLGDDELGEFLGHRDITTLDFASWEVKPCVLQLMPIRPEFEKWIPTIGQPDSAWTVFSHHCIETPDGWGIEFGTDGKGPKIKDSQRQKISQEIVVEAAAVIAERVSRGGDLPLPHTLPAMWQRAAIRSRLHHAASQKRTAHTS